MSTVCFNFPIAHLVEILRTNWSKYLDRIIVKTVYLDRVLVRSNILGRKLDIFYWYTNAYVLYTVLPLFSLFNLCELLVSGLLTNNNMRINVNIGLLTRLFMTLFYIPGISYDPTSTYTYAINYCLVMSQSSFKMCSW